MWFVKYGEEYLHDPRIGLTLQSTNPTVEINASTEFSFNITVTHPMYNKIREYDPNNPIVVYQDETIIYKGEITKINDDFQLTKTVTCKSDLGYLNHSIVRPYSTLKEECDRTCPSTVDGYFEFLIKEHNDQASSVRRFSIGINEGSSLDVNNYIYRADSNYPTVGNVVTEKIINSVGGYLRTRYDKNVTYIDLLSDMPNVNSQIIDFGKNLLDFVKYEDSDGLATFVIPLGKQIEQDSENNSGKFSNRLVISAQSIADLTVEKNLRKKDLDNLSSSASADEKKRVQDAYNSAVNAVNDATANSNDKMIENGYYKSGDIIYSEKSVNKYGWLGAAVDYDDVGLVSNLVKRGLLALKSMESPIRTIEIKAVDLSLLDPSIKPIHVGDYVRARSKPHNFDSYMLCTRIDYDLNNPDNNTFTLGTTFDTLTGQQNKRINSLNATINTVYEAADKLSAEAKASAIIAGKAQEDAQSAKRTAQDAKDSIPDITVTQTEDGALIKIVQYGDEQIARIANGIQGIQGPRGEQGVPGVPGTSGKTSYFHIKYANNSNPTADEMTEVPSEYIGTYVDFTEEDSVDPSDYTWSRFQGIQGERGEQGIPGVGKDGKTQYLHIAYALNSTGSQGFSTTDSANKLYIGQYADFVENDSEDYTKYTWTRIKGDKGDTGLAGNAIWTTSKAPGLPNCTFQKIDLTSDVGREIQIGDMIFCTYLTGMFVVDSVDEDTVHTGLGTSLKGSAGQSGSDGSKWYTGTVLTGTNTDGSIWSNSGISNAALNDMYLNTSTGYTYKCVYPGVASKAKWAYAGSIKGPTGPSGKSAYQLAVAAGYTGTEAEWLESLKGEDGISPTVSVTRSGNSTTITVINADGTTSSQTVNDGESGTPGKSGYVHVKYSNDGKTFTSNSGETPGDWIGVYTDNTEADSTTFSKYTWTKIKGDDGEDGKTPVKGVDYFTQGDKDAIAKAAADDIQIGGRNLASKVNIQEQGSGTLENDGYSYTQMVGNGNGIKFPASMFSVGKSYVLSFKFQKSGTATLTKMGGHSAAFTTNKIVVNDSIVDGIHFANGVNIADSTKAQYCEVYLTRYSGYTGSDANLYIQPQRGSYHTSNDISIKYWDIKIEEGNKFTGWSPAPEDVDAAIDASIDSIQVGGRNLILNTGDTYSFTDTMSDHFALSGWAKDNIASDDLLTLTFEAKSTQSQYIDFYWRTSSTSYDSGFYPSYALTTTYQKFEPYVHASQIPNGALYLRVRSNSTAHGSSTKLGTISIRNLKLEKGNKATDWTPAPEDVDTQIDNIQIGGRNLIRNSNFAFNGSNWTAEGLTMAFGNDPTYGTYAKLTTSTAPQRIYQLGGTTPEFKWNNKQRYQYSFWAKTESGTAAVTASRSGADYGTQHTATTSWQKFSGYIDCTADVAFGTGTLSIYVNTSNAIVYVTMIMLEKGDKGTDWSPAPEDINASIIAGKTFYGTCSTAAATADKVSTDVTGFKTEHLVAGTQVAIKFTNANSVASPTLNINNLGKKNIYRYGTTAPSTSAATSWNAGSVVTFTYDGTNWISNNWLNNNDNTYDRNRLNVAIKAASAIVAANIIVGTSSGYKHLKAGTAFDVNLPILYAAAAITSGSTGTNNYTSIPFTVTTTQSITLTAYKPVYIKGTISGTMFTPVSTTPLTQTEPTTVDGYVYMRLGYAYAASTLYLEETHPIYVYSGGKLVDYASSMATNYMDFVDDTGLIVGNMNDDTLGNNTLIDSTGVAIRNGDVELSRFGSDSIRIGKTTAKNALLDANGMAIRNGTTEMSRFDANSISLGKNLPSGGLTITAGDKASGYPMQLTAKSMTMTFGTHTDQGNGTAYSGIYAPGFFHHYADTVSGIEGTNNGANLVGNIYFNGTQMTDVVTAQSKSSGWSYIKFKSGLAICWKRYFNQTTGTRANWNSSSWVAYGATRFSVGSYPFSMNYPTELINLDQAGSQGLFAVPDVKCTNTTGKTYYICSVNLGDRSSVTYNADVVVFGAWK